MRRLTLFVVSLVPLLCGSTAHARSLPTPLGWTHFVSLRYPYSIDYPPKWRPTQSKKTGEADAFQGPPWTTKAPHISVSAKEAGKRVTLAAVKSREIASIDMGGKVLSSE